MGQNFWTYVLSNDTVVINESQGFKNLSMELISGSASFIGTGQGDGTLPPASIALITNKPVNLSSGSVLPIDGITITATSGVVNIMAF